MAKYTLPQQMKVVEALAPAADAAGRTGAYVSLKNAAKAYVMVHLTQGNAATVLISVLQASDIAGTGAKALGNAVPIWVNQDTSLGDTLVRQADGLSFTTSAAVKNKQVIVEVDATALDVNNGFDCIAVSTGASNAANVTQAQYLLAELRYGQAAPPSALVN